MLSAVVQLGWFLFFVSVLVLVMSAAVWAVHNPQHPVGDWFLDHLGTWKFYIWPDVGMPKAGFVKIQKKQSIIDQQLVKLTDINELVKTATLGSYWLIDQARCKLCGIMLLLELQYFGKDPKDKVHVSPNGERLREFIWYSFDNFNRVLAYLPSAEGRRQSWYLLEDHSDRIDVGITEFMSGTDTNPGPAKAFAKSRQQTRTPFQVPGLEETWIPMDIIWADMTARDSDTDFGNNFAAEGARVAFFVAACKSDPSCRLVFADLRSGGGSDMLYIGRTNDDLETLISQPE